MSTLSTHILDISTGKPAQGVRVYLEQDGVVLATAFTNAQGASPHLSLSCLQDVTGWWLRLGLGSPKPAATRFTPAHRSIL